MNSVPYDANAKHLESYAATQFKEVYAIIKVQVSSFFLSMSIKTFMQHTFRNIDVYRYLMVKIMFIKKVYKCIRVFENYLSTKTFILTPLRISLTLEFLQKTFNIISINVNTSLNHPWQADKLASSSELEKPQTY